MTSVQLSTLTRHSKTATQLWGILLALASVSLTLPVEASNADSFSSLNQSELEEETAIAPESEVIQLAQLEGSTLVFFQTDDYAVRVLDRGAAGLFMNVFNQRTGIQEQNGVPATALPRREGEPVRYLSSSSRDGGIAYIASVLGRNLAELQIIDADGDVRESERTNRVTANIPGIDRVAPDELETLALHRGSRYTARVLERTDGVFMNVYDGRFERQILNGRPAQAIPTTGEFQDWTTYLSNGTFNGVPAAYYLRISPRGQTQLDVVRQSTGELLSTEATGRTVTSPGGSIPDPRTTSLVDAYVVAVPGNQTTLNRILPIYPQAYLDRSRQGNFVNAGSFTNRNSAFAQMFDLRGRGFDARVVYRNVSYR
ncbi:hypothetical protein [Sphaerothrix gracilis]|uniref:hypothetical protein n=1 Tax=Sphaerothrix gracilis TaxID=3151835 RepID=UPI0031FD6381